MNLGQKGDEVHCVKCGSHIATLVNDLGLGVVIESKLFSTFLGQGPWRTEPARCRKCKTLWIQHGRLAKLVRKSKIIQ